MFNADNSLKYIYIFLKCFCLADAQFVEPTNEIEFAPFDIVESRLPACQIIRLTQPIDTVIERYTKLQSPKTCGGNNSMKRKYDLKSQCTHHLYGIFIKDFVGGYVVSISFLQQTGAI